MNDQARLLEGSFSQGLETLTQLARHAGFTVELGKLIRQPGGVERAIRALRNEFFESKMVANESVLAEGEYRLYVDCSFPRTLKELRAVFKDMDQDSRDIWWCTDYKHYNKHHWVIHSTCIGSDQTPGERVLTVIRLNGLGYRTSEEFIAGLDKLGYRPANHLELYAVAKTQTLLPSESRVVALGSSKRYGTRPTHMALTYSSGQYKLEHMVSDSLRYGNSFLAVRK